MADEPRWESELFEFRSFNFGEYALQMATEGCTAIRRGREDVVEIDARTRSADLYLQFDSVDELDRVRLSGRVTHTGPAATGTWLQVLCEQTRFERHVSLTQADGAWPYEVVLDPADLRGVVVVRPMLIDEREQAGGLVVAIGDGLQLRFDAPSAPFGGGLPTKWTSTVFVERGIPKALTFLEVLPDTDPVLYLNDGIRDFRVLLQSRGSHGSVARVRQLLLDTIESDTWFTLGRRAADQAYRLTGDESVELVDEAALDGWAGAALDRIARFLGLPQDESAREHAAVNLLSASHHEQVRAAIDSHVGTGGLGTRMEALISDLARQPDPDGQR
jgi:hypothetical protein